MNCYNGARYLNDSLRSIINQTFQNWELLFWDNRSTDNSKKILESFKETRFKYYMSPKFTNLGEARYLASKHIYGDLLAILDTDDVWLPNKLEEQVNIFNKNQDLGLIYTNTIFFDKKNNHTLYSKKQNSGNLFNHLLFNYNISLETVLINLKYKNKIKCIIHTAAQPSHDWAAKEPLTDFTINANGTLNLLYLANKYCKKSVFIYVSTNKVYGDTPNYLPLYEKKKKI